MRVSILIMAFLPPFRALTSASSARVAASLHWASRSFLSFSKFMASSCSQRSSSARRAASTIARAALSSDSLGLVDVGHVSQGLVGVSELLLSSATLTISSLEESTSLLKAVGNGSSPAVGGDLGIGGGRLASGLLVNLHPGIAHLQGVLLDGGLGLSVASNGVLKGQTKVASVSLKLLLHPESLSLALGLSLKGNLH